LKIRKNRKFMGPQDDLAVVATGRALESAALRAPLGDRAGVFLGVGHIPFELDDIDVLVKSSTVDGRFSMGRFTADGYNSVSPLLTFRCLTNMPAFHISVNADVRGPYFVTYPDSGQLYVALDEACAALEEKRVDIALLVGVAHRRNFLVEHHFGRLSPPVEPTMLRDAAGCLVLERADDSARRSAARRGRLVHHEIGYRPHDPFAESLGTPSDETGPASLPTAFCAAPAGRFEHRTDGADGVEGFSVWEKAEAP